MENVNPLRMEVKQMDFIDRIIQLESGQMNTDELIKFFQEMIDDGMVWQLQGSYGRMAQALINGGACHEKRG
jgi:hypothetical protein